MNAGRKPPRFPLSESESDPLETLALWVIGASIVAGAALWLAGEFSGRIFAGSWPGLDVAEMGGVVARFAIHVSDPAQAWPVPERQLIPGPLAFYGTLATMVVPPLVGGVVFLRRRSKALHGAEANARWARPRDLRPLRVRAPEPGRLTLGLVDGRLIAAEPRQSVIVIGPVQTGKTSGFAVPAILEWRGPVVATSVKTDLLRETLAARSAIPGANVWVYDPTGGTGIPSAGWTPLAGCHTWQGAQRVAAWLSAAARRGGGGVENAEFWYAAAAKLLAPLLFAAAVSERTMADVVRWVDSQAQEEVFDALDQADEDAAVTAFQASTLRDDRTRSGIYTTTETVLAAYAEPSTPGSA